MPGLVTQGRAKLLKEELGLEDAASEDYVSEDDAVTEHSDRYQMLEDNAEGSGGEGSSGESSSGESSSREGSGGEGSSRQEVGKGIKGYMGEEKW